MELRELPAPPARLAPRASSLSRKPWRALLRCGQELAQYRRRIDCIVRHLRQGHILVHRRRSSLRRVRRRPVHQRARPANLFSMRLGQVHRPEEADREHQLPQGQVQRRDHGRRFLQGVPPKRSELELRKGVLSRVLHGDELSQLRVDNAADASSGSTTAGSTCTVICRAGHVVSGNGTTRRQASGSQGRHAPWSGLGAGPYPSRFQCLGA